MMKTKLIFIGILLLSKLLSAQYIKVEDDSVPIPKPHGISGTPLIYTPELMEYLNSFGEGTYAKSLNKIVSDSIGIIKKFYVYNIELSKFENIDFKLMAKGSISQVWCSKDELDNGHLTQAVADTFLLYLENKTGSSSVDPDKGIIAIDQEYFGDPPDKDGDGFVDALLCDIKDGWESGSSGGYVAGFFHPQDQSNTANSNKADIIYLDSYPGIFYGGNVNPNGALETIAHEYQHLIHFRYDRSEYTFMNEGLSENAEYITGLYTRESRSYLANVNVPIFRWNRSDALPDYSRASLFMNYVGDRFGLSNYKYHTQNPLSGPQGFNAALDSSGYPDVKLADVIHDFHIANLVNDRTIDEKYGYLNPDRRWLFIPEQTTRKIYSDAGNTGSISVFEGAAAYLTFDNIDVQESVFTFPLNVKVSAVIYSKDGTVNVLPLESGVNTTLKESAGQTIPLIHYVLSNTTPSGNEDINSRLSKVSWVINGAKSFHYKAISTYGSKTSVSYWALPYYNSSQVGRFGFTNKYVMPEDGVLAEMNLFIIDGVDNSGNPIKVKGDGKLRIAIFSDNEGIPDTVMAEDTLDFSDINSLWNKFDIASWNLSLKKDDVVHAVYELMVPVVDNSTNSIPLRLDDGRGEQGVTQIITAPGEYAPMFVGDGSGQNGVWNKLVYKVSGAEAPSDVKAEAGDQQVALTWVKSLYKDFKMYKIYGGLNTNPQTVLDSVLFADTTNAVITGLQNGKKYYFTMTVVDNNGKESDHSMQISATPMSRAVADIQLGVLQNPVFTEYIDIFLASNDALDPNSISAQLKQGGSSLAIGLVNKDGTNKVFQNTKQKLQADGEITILARIRLPLSVSYAYDTLSFTTTHLSKNAENIVFSYGKNIRLKIKESTIERDFNMLVIPQENKLLENNEAILVNGEKYVSASEPYFFSPDNRTFKAEIRWDYSGKDGRNVFLARVTSDGYLLIPTRFDALSKIISANISASGKFILLKSLSGKENYSTDVPKEFSLEQNYPNPFNPQTTIKFSLPVEQAVQLDVYNMLGQKIITLFDGELAAGYHRFVWDGKNYLREPAASGIYLYRLRAGDRFVQIKKMTLIR